MRLKNISFVFCVTISEREDSGLIIVLEKEQRRLSFLKRNDPWKVRNFRVRLNPTI